MARRGGHKECPRRTSWRFYDVENDYQSYRVTCGSNTCPYCVDTNVWKWGLAFGHAAPDRYAVLTQLSGDWQTDRESLRVFFQRLRRKGYALAHFETVEINPKGTGYHLNLWWHGTYVPQSVLSEAAVAVGWGSYVHVKKWDSARRDYGMKEAASRRDYGMKEALARGAVEGPPSMSLDDVQAAYLARNGGRLAHASPTFWRDGPGGRPLSSMRATLDAYWASEGATRRRSEQWVMSGPSDVLMLSEALRPVSGTPVVMTGTSTTAVLLQPGLF